MLMRAARVSTQSIDLQGTAMVRYFGFSVLLLAGATTGLAAPNVAARVAQGVSPREYGEYVARAADCMSCHTASPDKPFAGGNPLKSAYGIIYGTNITADRETGIGNWTKEDFVRALRQGIRKDGAYLYPAMPYTSYTKMSPRDLDALWEYIHSLPPISNSVPKNTLPFPLSVRSGMAVWQSLYFKPGLFEPIAGKAARWNRGAYLVQALGHCNDCHTPRNIAQGPEAEHQLSGAQIEGWYAPDISSDSVSKLLAWNTGQLAKFLKTGVAPDNAKAVGPMQEVIHDSLQYLSDSDLQAMAAYLKDQSPDVQPVTPTKSSLPRLGEGKLLYQDHCSSCHQNNGKGISGTVPALAGNDAVTGGEPYNVIMAMLEGFAPQGNWGAMASFAETLNDDQISAIANYVRTAWGNAAAVNATPWSVGNWRKNVSSSASDSRAMLCPTLAQDVIQPALKASPDSLQQAARERGKLRILVAGYQSARPNSSKAQVIEALSTAYCRVLSNEHQSEARMSAQIADFAQQVAEVLALPASATATPRS
jgi:mono/diheme cytochrome c family protein